MHAPEVQARVPAGRVRGAEAGARRRRPGWGGARPSTECGRILGEVRTPGGRSGRGGELDTGRPSRSAGAAAPAPSRGADSRAGFRRAAARQGQEAARRSPRTTHPPGPAPRAPPPAAASSRRPPSSLLRLRRGAGAGARARGGARAQRRPLRTCRARAQASTGWSSTRPCGRCRSGCRGCARWAPAPTARSGRGGGEGGEGGEGRAGLSARPLPSLCEVPGVGRGLAPPPPPGLSRIAAMNGGWGASRKLSYRAPFGVGERGRSSAPSRPERPPPGPNPAASQSAKGRVSQAPEWASMRLGWPPAPHSPSRVWQPWGLVDARVLGWVVSFEKEKAQLGGGQDPSP